MQQQVEDSGSAPALPQEPFPIQLVRKHLPFTLRASQTHFLIPSLLQTFLVSILHLCMYGREPHRLIVFASTVNYKFLSYEKLKNLKPIVMKIFYRQW